MTTVALTTGIVEPIGDWRSLVDAIKNWANRKDWSDAQVGEFITLAEARFNRVLRVPDMEVIAESEFAADANSNNAERMNPLPTDMLTLRSIYLDCTPLKAMSPSGLIEEYGNRVGTPQAYAIIGSEPRKIRLAPQPGGAVSVSIIYYRKIPNVTETNADNWLLNEHPDIYLFACLVAAEAYVVNDERLPLWKAAVDEAIAELNDDAMRSRYGGAPLVANTRAHLGRRRYA